MPFVTTLRVAPVKGLASVIRDEVWLDAAGVAEDRRVLLLDDDGAVITLRSHPRLVRIVPDLDLAGGVLSVTMPDGTVAASELADAGTLLHTSLYGKQRAGHELPGDVADALTSAAGERVRVMVADTTGVGWDEGPVSLLGSSSAAALGGPDADAARYRMLVEIDGTQPYEEDTWVGRDVALGDAVVHVTQQLGRCVIITHSPVTGEKDWDGLGALARERGPGQLCLGVIAAVTRPGAVRVGSPVRAL